MKKALILLLLIYSNIACEKKVNIQIKQENSDDRVIEALKNYNFYDKRFDDIEVIIHRKDKIYFLRTITTHETTTKECIYHTLYHVSLIGSKVYRNQKSFFRYENTCDPAPYFGDVELKQGDLIHFEIDKNGNLVASFKKEKIIYKAKLKEKDKLDKDWSKRVDQLTENQIRNEK